MYTRSQAVVCACALFAAGAAEAFAASPDGTLFMPSTPSATSLGEDFYVGSGEEAVLGDIYEFASISVEGGTLRSTAAAYVADDIRISAGGRFEMTDLPDENVYTIADGALRLEHAQVRLAGSRPGADLELATESLHVDGVSEIILECASDAFDKTQSVHASFINGVSLEAGATLDARIGRGTAMSIGAEFSGLPLDNEFKHRDNRYSKGLLVVAAPFELASGMHFNVGSSETAAGENLLLGAEGVLVVTRGDVLSAASEPIFSAADDTTIRFDAGSEIWLSTSCGENIDEALAAIDFGGTDISGLGNVLVSYDGQNGRFELDGDGRYTVRFEPMRFSGPFAGMLETLWVSRHDLLLPGFFRAIYERASAKAGEAALLNASVLASRLGTDERLAHLNERAAGETPFRWLGAAGTGKRDGLYLGTLPLHVAFSAGRSEDETGVGAMRGQIRSDNVTAEASGAAAFGAWRVGVGAAFESSDIKTKGGLENSASIPVSGESDAVLLQVWAGREITFGTLVFNAAWSEASEKARTTSYAKRIEVDDVKRSVWSAGAAWRSPEASYGSVRGAFTARAQLMRFDSADYAVGADGEAFLNAEESVETLGVFALDADLSGAKAVPRTGTAFIDERLPERLVWHAAGGVSYFAGDRERTVSLSVPGWRTPGAQVDVPSIDALLVRASGSVALESDDKRIALEGFGACSNGDYRSYGALIRCEWLFSI